MSRGATRAALLVACVFAGLAVGSSGCGDDDAAPRARPEAPTEPTEDARRRPARDALYGADGDLLPSDDTFLGLTLPRGLELEAESRMRRRFTTQVPLRRVLGYFGPRLITGTVERVGDGAIYRRAVPKEAQGARVPMDVSVLPSSTYGRVVVILEELPVTPTKSPTKETIEQLLQRPE